MGTLIQLLVNIDGLVPKGKTETEVYLKRLKFLVGDQEREKNIPRGPLDNCKTMLDVFIKMQEMVHMSKGNLDDFKSLMNDVFAASPLLFKVQQLIKEYEDGCASIQARSGIENSITTDTDSDGRWVTGYSGASSPQLGRTLSPTNRFVDLDSNFAEDTSSLDRISHSTSRSVDATLPKRFATAFEYAASKIGVDWKIFAELASIDQSDVYSIEENRSSEDIHKRAYTAFHLWYKTQSKPSMTIFRKTLRSIPRNDIADDLKEMDKKD